MQRWRDVTLRTGLGVFALLFVMTVYEYYTFAKHVERLRVLQEDYRAYLAHVSVVAEQPTESKESQEAAVIGSAETAEEESNDIDEDESDGDEAEDFLVINRSVDYLREAAIDFYVQQNLHDAVTQLTDAWQPYNDWHLQQREAKVVPAAKKKQSKKRPAKKTHQITLHKGPSTQPRFAWPIDPSSFWLSSLYGPRKRKDGSQGFHHGLDMAAIKGTHVKAAKKGRVVGACYTAGWGNNVLIDHLDGRYKTRYAHLDKIHVYNGQYVTEDTWIGNVGATGRVRKKGRDASHLHFEVYDRGKRVNPLLYLG